MRKFVSLVLLGAVAGVAMGQGSSATLAANAKAMSEARTFGLSFSVQPVGGAPAQWRVDLAKPNKARIESPEQVIIADGKTITVLDKAENTYIRDPQTDAALLALFDRPELRLWTPFFQADAFAKVTSARDGATRNRRGATLRSVEVAFDPAGENAATVYVDTADNLVKQAELRVKDARMILNAGDGAAPSGDLFAFNAPEGSREIPVEERTAGKWFSDLEEGMRIARAQNKLVLIHFTAVWCGPCRMTEREVYASADFKRAAKDFVLVKIDIDQQPAVAERFGVTSIPNIKIMKADGAMVHEFVGYRPTPEYLAQLDEARRKAGR